MRRQQTWWRAGMALAAVWIVVGVGLWQARRQRPTAQKAIDFLASHPLESLPPAERMRQIEEAARQVNHLSFEERHHLLLDASQRRFYRQMTDEEKRRYLDLMLATGMRQMMEAFNQMPPERRRQLLEQGLKKLDRYQGGTREQLREQLANGVFERIVQEGLASYFRDATADSKLELQPLLEQVQHIVQAAR